MHTKIKVNTISTVERRSFVKILNGCLDVVEVHMITDPQIAAIIPIRPICMVIRNHEVPRYSHAGKTILAERLLKVRFVAIGVMHPINAQNGPGFGNDPVTMKIL